MRAVVLLLLILCGHATAQETSASALMDEATRLFTEEADLEGALHKFEASFAAQPSWRALNGVALVYQQQGRYIAALETYDRLIASFAVQLSERQLATVQQRIHDLEGRTSVLRVSVAPPDSTVLVDGAELPCPTGVCRARVLVGQHSIVASHTRHH